MSASDNKKALQAVFEAMAVGNTRPFGELMADDCIWSSPGQSIWSGTWRGKKAMNDQLFAPLYKRFEGKYTNHAARFIADGDVVVIEARGEMTSKTGVPYNNEYCLIYRLRDGKIVEITEYNDSALCERVLGPFA